MKIEFDFRNDGQDKVSVPLCQMREWGAFKGLKLELFADEGSKPEHRSGTEGPFVENFIC